MRKIKAAIVGCGVISEVYLDSIRENFQILDIVACSDLDEVRMNNTAQKYGIRAVTYEQILNDPEMEMVINLTSPAAHYPLTKQALEHGKHVYSEKMLAVELEQAKELCRIAEEKKVRLGCAPDTFLGGGIQTAKYVLEKGLIGTAHSGLISLSRDYRVYGENLPHLFRHGGSVLYDMGCYYLTAFASLLGPVKSVMAFGKKTEESHKVGRVSSRFYGQEIPLDDCNVITAVLAYENDTLVTLHMNSSSIVDETFHLELYGDRGILRLGDPNTFGGSVSIQKPHNQPVAVPFSHGFQEQSRGLGAAEMAWSILQDRPHRASKEMACHVLETVHGIFESIETQKVYQMTTTFRKPEMLPEGYIGKGFWEPEEETALL